LKFYLLHLEAYIYYFAAKLCGSFGERGGMYHLAVKWRSMSEGGMTT
jgi:hypothetical protein